MMNRRIELRPAGVFVIHDIGEHPLEYVVGHG